MMNRKRFFYVALWVAAALAFTANGCSRFGGPSDEEIIKTVSESDIFKNGNIVLLSPVVIVKKESRQKDGGWPVKVKITVAGRTKDGKTGTPLERTPTFKFFKSKDSAGNTIWKSRIGGV